MSGYEQCGGCGALKIATRRCEKCAAERARLRADFEAAGDDIGAFARRAIDPNDYGESCFQCARLLPRTEWWAQYLGYEEGPCCSERCALNLAIGRWRNHQPREVGA